MSFVQINVIYCVFFSVYLFKVNVKIFLLSSGFSVLDNSNDLPESVIIAEWHELSFWFIFFPNAEKITFYRSSTNGGKRDKRKEKLRGLESDALILTRNERWNLLSKEGQKNEKAGRGAQQTQSIYFWGKQHSSLTP